MTTETQPVSYGRVVLALAATMIVFAGLRASAPIFNPILFAAVLAIIFHPLYVWLRKRLPTALAIVLIMFGLIALFGTIGWIVTLSATRLTTQLTFYATQLEGRLDTLDRLLERLWAADVNIGALLNSSAIVNAAGLVLGSLVTFFGNTVLILLLILFFLLEGPALIERLRESFARDNETIKRLLGFGSRVGRQFGLRAIINAVVAVAYSLFLWLLGVDYPLLWGVLTFFLGYIPYLGIMLAGLPGVLLALAQFGFGSALLVVVGLTVINMSAENLLVPLLMGRGFSLSPTAVFLTFYFWTWLLGTTGAFLSMPLLFLSVIVFESFRETRWIANLLVVRPPAKAEERAPEPIQHQA
jgi:predicted PurR-regulated permease PerM